jgi:hypothetical protein
MRGDSPSMARVLESLKQSRGQNDLRTIHRAVHWLMNARLQMQASEYSYSWLIFYKTPSGFSSSID